VDIYHRPPGMKTVPLLAICGLPSLAASEMACLMNMELSGIVKTPLTEFEAFALRTRLVVPAPDVIVVISARFVSDAGGVVGQNR